MIPLLFAWLGAAAFVSSLAYFLFSYLVRFGVSPIAPGGEPLLVWPSILTNLALFTAFALHHSLFARTRLKAMVSARLSPVLERPLYTWIASILFITVCAAWRPVPGVLYSVPSPWHWIGFAVQAAGIVVTFLGASSLDALDLAGVRQVLRARTTGAPPAHVDLQTSGVYGLVRHPLYFGWVLLVFGAPHMTATRFAFAAISSVYLAVAIPFEERALDETFGPAYARYRQLVRWRMVPFVY